MSGGLIGRGRVSPYDGQLKSGPRVRSESESEELEAKSPYQRFGLLFTPLIVTFTVRPARQNHAPPPCMSLDMYPIHLPHASRLQFHRCVVMLHMSDHHPETRPAAAMPGNFARVIANDCTAGPARPDPASSSPLAHWDPLGTWPAGNDARAALTRANYGLQRATLSQVRPFGEACWLYAASALLGEPKVDRAAAEHSIPSHDVPGAAADEASALSTPRFASGACAPVSATTRRARQAVS